jgi:hypothetical protein
VSATPVDIIIGMIFNAVTLAKKEDRQALVVVLGVMIHVIDELPGDNSALVSYIENVISRFSMKP